MDIFDPIMPFISVQATEGKERGKLISEYIFVTKENNNRIDMVFLFPFQEIQTAK